MTAPLGFPGGLGRCGEERAPGSASRTSLWPTEATGGWGPGPHIPELVHGVSGLHRHWSGVARRCGRVCRRQAGLLHPGHDVQEPHRHLHLHLPPGHAAPAGLWGGLHRYRRASGMQGLPAPDGWESSKPEGVGGQTLTLEVEASSRDSGLPPGLPHPSRLR